MKIGWIIVAAAALSFGQTPSKKETPPATKKATAPAAPDSWERRKECAAQAEKAMVARDAQVVRLGGKNFSQWSNHYSAKYNRCFVRILYLFIGGDTIKGGPMDSTVLMDAFERSDLARTAWGLTPEVGCRDEQKPEDCAATARGAWAHACSIEDESTDCAKAKQFIEEHMKN